MPISFNGTNITKVNFNDKEIDQVYVNGSIVYSKTLVNNVINVECVYIRPGKIWSISAIAQYPVVSNVTVTISGQSNLTLPISAGNKGYSGTFTEKESTTWKFVSVTPSQDTLFYYQKGTLTQKNVG
ncbi:MAG TPA: hypothetical protein VIL24_05270 [Clostridia bacterium]